MPLEPGKIYQGDCLEQMREIEDGSVDLVFADPPFNIGHKYDKYDDRQDDEVYMDWSKSWIESVYRVLKPNGTFWLAIGDEYAAELKVAAQREIGFHTRSWVVWYYTFGVNCTKKFSRSHAHLLHFVKDANDFRFNADDPALRIPSARALVYGDKRANPKGRLPDDTWILRPQDFQSDPYGYDPQQDTWYFARVAGTFKERQGFHGCQMPEQLLGRVIRTSSNPGDLVLDPFSGSGTTLAVAKKLGRRWLGCELSEDYVRYASERLDAVHLDEPLTGPADPIASAPTTAAGRRLRGTPAADAAVQTKEPVEPDPPASAATAEANQGIETTTPLPQNTQTNDQVDKTAAAILARPNVRKFIRDVLVDAFYDTHNGYSSDWLLANPDLQNAFHGACRNQGLIGNPVDWNRELIRLRKAGQFPKRGKTKFVQVTAAEMDAYNFAAEIAWRLASNEFKDVSLDAIFCDPAKAARFDRHAKRFAPGFQLSEYRWAALRLRKASRELVKEVKAFHYVFETRDFTRFQNWDRLNLNRCAEIPGVYLLRGENKQPLYVGETSNLGERLSRHRNAPATARQVRHIAWITDRQLPSHEYRQPLKVDLVNRYQPLWNVNLVGVSEEATLPENLVF